MAAIAELISPQEYLMLERESETRNEFIDNAIHPRAISTYRHVLITGNVGFQLHSQLKATPYCALMCNMRIKVNATKAYFYPDVVVPCAESLHEDKNCDTLLNPTVIIEIYSTATECFDRGKKFHQYRQLESLTEYLLIAQDSHRIEHYIRQLDGQWLFSEAVNMDDIVHLPTIDCKLPLSEVYDDVQFESETSRLNGHQSQS